jgi:hypothetical protein
MTARRRGLLLAGLLAVAMLGALGIVWWAAGPRHRINRETIALVQEGMTEAEVEALFGVPAGNYSGGRGELAFMTGRRLRALSPSCKEWVGDETGARVAFDADGRVVWTLCGVVLYEETLLDRVRRWLRL